MGDSVLVVPQSLLLLYEFSVCLFLLFSLLYHITSLGLSRLLVRLTVRNHEVGAGLAACPAVRVPYPQLINHQVHLVLVPLELAKRMAEAPANLPHMCRVEVKPGVDSPVRAHQTHLERKRIN
jgi:hypothetical protein